MKKPLITVWSLLLFLPSAWSAPAKPNILVIVADDLGWGETGFQGLARDIPTPHLDSIAANGVRFTSGYVSGPYCSPTRAALLTGRYQQRFGHEFNPGTPAAEGITPGLPLEEKTIGDRLKEAGYATGWFGKSHLGNTPPYHPFRRGFDEFFGFLGGAHGYHDVGGGANAVLRGTEPVKNVDYLTDAFAGETAAFIGRRKDRPWFAYLAFNAVHTPLETLEKYEKPFAGITDGKRRKFAALLSALDAGVGTVLTSLREAGQEENTLIFFFSDNGGPTAQTTSANGPLRGFKAQTWEGGVRVPFAVQWKGKIPAGKTESRPVIQLDVLPTALAAAGVTVQPEWKLDGVNLLPYLTGENTAAPHDALYWRFGQQLAVRQGDWKLIKSVAGGGIEEFNQREPATVTGARLYNLADDIGEAHDLAAKEPEKVKELAALWETWNKGLVPAKWYPERRPQSIRANDSAPAAEGAAAGADGPWKSGDQLSRADSPQVAGKAFQVSAEIEPASPNGVIAAQGASVHGFSFFLKDGHLALAVRLDGELATVTSPQPLAPGRRAVEARVGADGQVSFLVDGQPAGGGKLPGLISSHPGQGLTVGGDGDGSVGEYEAPHSFQGVVEQVKVTFP